ncbi:ArsR/SmtB family transcription factor [Microlunatus soli]|uniref:ArsR/SmtB family transcription factor n=1 Tax=Microlunatus soli TaxID=630515 RepID=UPI0015610BDC|nr:SRPBCC domain-containing protein [Microlunatus soli]
MGDVFRALADETRRDILDLLRRRDGRTLVDLTEHFPKMTRFGVASHLRVLEEAELITIVRAGREKHHHLNAVPLQEIAARWLSDFSAHQARALLALRNHLEGSSMSDSVYRIRIRCTAEALWRALTDNDTPRPWMWGGTIRSGWAVGDRYAMSGGGVDLIVGEVLEADRPRRLRLTFDPRWDDTVSAEQPGTLEYEIRVLDDGVCELIVTIAGLDGASAASVAEDTPEIYSSLKSYLETGAAL